LENATNLWHDRLRSDAELGSLLRVPKQPQFNRIKLKQISKILSCVATKSDAHLKPNLRNSRWLQANLRELSIALQAIREENVLKSYLTTLDITLKRKIKHVLNKEQNFNNTTNLLSDVQKYCNRPSFSTA
jgi:hypothetical protein